MSKTKPPVILYSKMLHRWEAWKGGRPIAHSADLSVVQAAFPKATEPSAMQHRMAHEDADQR